MWGKRSSHRIIGTLGDLPFAFLYPIHFLAFAKVGLVQGLIYGGDV